MKTLIPLTVLAALSACSQEAAQPSAETTAPAHPALTAAEAAGTYDYTLADGTTGTTALVPDGTFTDRMEGETVAGSWNVAGGRICVDPAGEGTDQRRNCYSLGEPDANGVQIATSDTGELVKVVKRPA